MNREACLQMMICSAALCSLGAKRRFLLPGRWICPSVTIAIQNKKLPNVFLINETKIRKQDICPFFDPVKPLYWVTSF